VAIPSKGRNSRILQIVSEKGRFSVNNRRGQGLVEYLVIVALIGVASMAVIRVVGANLSIQFARVNEALGGRHIDHLNEANVTADMVKKKDLTNFLEGARLENSNGRKDRDDSANR
jgi:pilus assembly protein Flp/PilA